jgi:hypothetical protein
MLRPPPVGDLDKPRPAVSSTLNSAADHEKITALLKFYRTRKHSQAGAASTINRLLAA